MEYILNGILWVLALYGLFELIKTIIYTYTYTNLKEDGIYVIIAAKNQESRIEGFLRSFLFRILYGKEENVKDVIVVDLNSKDETKEILEKLGHDYENIKVSNWRESKEILDSVDEVRWQRDALQKLIKMIYYQDT